MTEAVLRDGRLVTLRGPTLADIGPYDVLDRAIVLAGKGVVIMPGELSPGRARATRTITRFLERADEDLLLLASADEDVLVGSVDISRLPYAGIRHNGTLTIGIHPDWQGAGLGRLLLAAALRWAVADGLRRVELSVLGDNVRAQRLYASVGFREVYRRERFLRHGGAWIDDAVMVWTAPGEE